MKDRLAHLDDSCKDLLHTAALIGRDVSLDVLAQAADLDIQTCLDRLEPLEALGLLERTPADPFSYPLHTRFGS